MIIINTIDVQKFSFNGIPYFKNFTPFSRGGKIKVLNVYDAKLELCEFKNPEEFTVNGVVYANIADLQDALLPVLYTRNSLNSNDDLFAQIIQAGTSVLDEENRTYTFSDWKWKLYGPVFEPAPFTTDEIPEEDEGESRVYHVLGSNTGNYVINPGPSGVIPVDPGPILNTIYLTRFVVSGNVIGSVEAPILGSEYVRKNYSNRHTIFSGVVDGVYPLPADGRTSFVFDIGGFDFEGFYFPEDLFFTDHLYEGKLFYFKNTSGAPVTLKHDGESDVWFNHAGATDLVFESSEEKTLMFKFSFSEGLTLLNGNSDSVSSNLVWFYSEIFNDSLTGVSGSTHIRTIELPKAHLIKGSIHIQILADRGSVPSTIQSTIDVYLNSSDVDTGQTRVATRGSGTSTQSRNMGISREFIFNATNLVHSSANISSITGYETANNAVFTNQAFSLQSNNFMRIFFTNAETTLNTNLRGVIIKIYN